MLVTLVVALTISVASCTRADTVSRNISKAADQFRINRRIVLYNGITGECILVIKGYCSPGNYDQPGELSVTCQVGRDQYKKHFLGLSDNVTCFAEQIDPVEEDPVSLPQLHRRVAGPLHPAVSSCPYES